MARYAPEHKEATRQRMIQTAGRRFKADGIDGSGIATLVADAGLTNGAFYGHFASKDNLVASVIEQQLADQAARMNSLPAGTESLKAIVREYLSPAHRDDLAGGCASAALLDEIGRCSEPSRQAYTAGTRAVITALARHLDDGHSTSAQDRAIGILALLIGSIQAARAITDRDLSDHILATAYTTAMTIASTSGRSGSPLNQEQP